MPHSYHRIWIHAIWATKERQPLIHQSVERKIYDFMTGQFTEMGCAVRIINGMEDHVHCLFLLNAQTSIAEVIKQVKGSSSHWINEQQLIKDRFSWQTGYAVYSVSESVMETVFQYIKNQKRHHKTRSFQVELDGLNQLHKLGGVPLS
ncbi:IS200/IS605 family transposase [Imperialibacter roseus]|uniref:IS200/IS605 family transposase n=1 Tax=Imperialibacter roseus TaxID=1324217 RepID=A0ABZ0IME9_9BACT|nr:IS200/IS605 family transposase [Imperialibacter roseus]WOK05495.1 IS200/IS605 family transposase [Imperialibacter roseus]